MLDTKPVMVAVDSGGADRILGSVRTSNGEALGRASSYAAAISAGIREAKGDDR